MNRFRLLAGTAALALILGAQTALAQTTLVGVRAMDDQINDIDRANDDYRYGNP